ncbi:hypothetical protein DAPPUDRAFT_108403 [Daphnia pulex]|uniref:Endonuclease/exonuclease/phosphatase domain-containing protein n=1 Tax=Daphnia pulex TaxID=6669 RepID=E9H036_DAPPU|nr:hypothetical protein DAPPUDRAFT_108403 [Daphnia pulex]|eukprot:EFX74950.1 hypothetical protein DAPPUDRAFT_108403 [Daphnia pulex]
MSRQQLLTTIRSMLIPPILPKALLFTIRFHGIARTPPTKRGRRGGKSAQASYSRAKQFLHCSLVNARSLLSRSHIVQHHIIENNLDFVAITESWLPVEGGDEILRGTCPAGYSGLHVPRTDRRGGGVAVIYRNTWYPSVNQPLRPKKTVEFRKTKSIDFNSFISVENISDSVSNMY